MEKKGQFYLIAAIIIVMIIVSLSTITNYITVSKKPEKFYDLSKELSEESSRVVEYGVYNEEDTAELIANFTRDYFVGYAAEKTDSTELVFIYGREGDISATVYKKESSGGISITYGSSTITVPAGKKFIISSFGSGSGTEIEVELLGKDYNFNLNQGENFFFVIAKGSGEEKYVATEGELYSNPEEEG